MSKAGDAPLAGAALRAAVARLAAAGIAGAARDARLLLAGAMGITPDRLILHLPDRLAPGVAETFAGFVSARAARQPVSQIVGRRAFWGRDFTVRRDVLDPRPETETLIAAALDAPFMRVLDLGTGSGAILLTLLAERAGATGLGSDLSVEALAVARANARSLGVADRAGFIASDWFARIEGRFDLVISNPPYIPAAEMPALAPEVRDWEPALALSPGGDGLDAYRAIAAGCRAHLVPSGRLLVEIGPDQAAPVGALLRAAGLQEIAVQRDLDGRDRVIGASAPGAAAVAP